MSEKMTNATATEVEDVPFGFRMLRNQMWTINWHKCGDGKEYTFKTRCPTEIDAFNALLQSEQGMCAGNIIVNSLYSE